MQVKAPIRVAIIGQGRSGRDIHGAWFHRDGGRLYRVVAIVDQLADRRERAKEEFGCDVYADYHSLFARSDIDLVVNATFSYQHYPVTMDLLKHGFNVLVEKPFAMHEADCEDMIRTAEEKGATLAVFQQSRYAPYYQQIKKILASGVLGEIVQVNQTWNGFSRRWDWQCSQKFGGGSMYNTCPHPMDQALELLGWESEVSVPFAKLACYNTSGDAEDYVKIILTAPGKPVIDLECSSADSNSPWLYTIQGSCGTLHASFNLVEWKYYRPELEPERPLILEPLKHEDGTPAYCGEQLTWHEERYEYKGDGFNYGVDCYYHMLYRHLAEGAPLEILPWQSKKQIAIMEEIHKRNPLPVKQ